MSPAPKRHWYQFSLKALLMVVTLSCVGLGWLAYERNEVRRREAAIAAIKKLGAYVGIDEAQSFRPQWLRPVLGDRSPGEVVAVYSYGIRLTDADAAHLAGLTKLRDLNLGGTQATDAGLGHLASLTNLKSLCGA